LDSGQREMRRLRHPSLPRAIGAVVLALSRSVARIGALATAPAADAAYRPSGPNPAEYAAMLRAVSEGIRAMDPGAKVVTAGLNENERTVRS
jgi:hypothetical protein